MQLFLDDVKCVLHFRADRGLCVFCFLCGTLTAFAQLFHLGWTAVDYLHSMQLQQLNLMFIKITSRDTTIFSYRTYLCLLFQPYDSLIQHHKFLFHHHVFMVVSEEPVFETAAFPNFIEKVRQGIPLVPSATEYILDATGAAVGYDIVHIPACLVQRCLCSSVFIFAGQFLFPPGAVVDSE